MSVLSRAELLLQAKNYSGSGDWLDESGNGHDAQLGSTSGADTNDPLFLRYAGSKYLYLPGIANNAATVPDSAALDISGDFDLIVYAVLADWGNGSGNQALIEKSSDYGLFSTDAGNLELWAHPGAVLASYASTAAIPFADGAGGWLRGTWNATTGVATFYTSTDPVGTALDDISWTQLGDAVAGTSGTNNEGEQDLAIGARTSLAGRLVVGRIYRAAVREGIDGTTVLDVDFNDATEPFASFTEGTGKTVTINRASSGRVSTVVDRDMFLLGTDDYFEIADAAGLNFGDGEDFTLMVAQRNYLFSSSMRLIDKRPTNDEGYALYTLPTSDINVLIEDTTTTTATDNNDQFAVGVASVATARRDESAGELEVFADGVGTGSPAATLGDLTNSDPLTIGSRAGTINFLDGEIHAVALWREALTDAEIAQAEIEIAHAGIPSIPSIPMLPSVG